MWLNYSLKGAGSSFAGRIPRHWQLMPLWMIIQLIQSGSYSSGIPNSCGLAIAGVIGQTPSGSEFSKVFVTCSILVRFFYPLICISPFGICHKDQSFHCTKTLLLDLAGKTAGVTELLFAFQVKSLGFCDLSRNGVPSRKMLLLVTNSLKNKSIFHLITSIFHVSISINLPFPPHPPKKNKHPVICY